MWSKQNTISIFKNSDRSAKLIHFISRVFCCLDFSKVFWAAMNFYGCFFWQQFRDIATELDLHQSFFTSLLLLYLVKFWNAQLCSLDWHQTKRGQKWGEFLTFQAISDACLLKNTVDSFKTLSVSASLLDHQLWSLWSPYIIAKSG